MHRRFWVIDVTSDFGIPTFVAVSCSQDPASKDEPLLYGTGAHFDVRLALLRALTEMNQALPAILSMRNTPGAFAARPKQARRMDHWPSHQISQCPYLTPDDQQPLCSVDDYAEVPYHDLAGALQHIISLVEQRDMDLLVQDQTRPDLALYVVKVIVPRLRPYWRRLAPGRLYDVPVHLGWRTTPCPESRMNPDPITR